MVLGELYLGVSEHEFGAFYEGVGVDEGGGCGVYGGG